MAEVDWISGFYGFIDIFVDLRSSKFDFEINRRRNCQGAMDWTAVDNLSDRTETVRWKSFRKFQIDNDVFNPFGLVSKLVG